MTRKPCGCTRTERCTGVPLPAGFYCRLRQEESERYDDFADSLDEELELDEYEAFDCHMNSSGHCGAAGSEDCEFEVSLPSRSICPRTSHPRRNGEEAVSDPHDRETYTQSLEARCDALVAENEALRNERDEWANRWHIKAIQLAMQNGGGSYAQTVLDAREQKP